MHWLVTVHVCVVVVGTQWDALTLIHKRLLLVAVQYFLEYIGFTV